MEGVVFTALVGAMFDFTSFEFASKFQYANKLAVATWLELVNPPGTGGGSPAFTSSSLFTLVQLTAANSAVKHNNFVIPDALIYLVIL